MKRFSLLLYLSAFCLLNAAEKPNFIIIFTDDQGYNDLGCFGSPTIRTPNIDRMAAEGMRRTPIAARATPACTETPSKKLPVRLAKF